MKFFVTFLVLFVIYPSNAQLLHFENIVSENKITNFENQKLIMIDFWATWCAPCLVATEQLEIFQEQNKDKFFAVSLSDESNTKISNFLKKSPIRLMVAVDIEKKIFSKYRVTTRPYAIVLDINGNLLWKGHPSDFSQKILDDLFTKTKNLKSKPFADLFGTAKVIETSFSDDFSGETIVAKSDITEDFLIKNKDKNTISFNGNLSEFIGIAKNTSISLIDLTQFTDFKISIKSTIENWDNKLTLLSEIQNKFSFEINSIEKNINVKIIEIENEKLLWDSNQIIWEEGANSYLVGNDRILGNDITVNKVAEILSKTKNEFYLYQGTNENKYDWDFHFLFDDLMQDELQSAFGLNIKQKTSQKFEFFKLLPIKKE